MSNDTTLHLPVRLADGSRTSVSIPATVHAVFLERLNGDRLRFAAHLRDAALVAQPRPGISRSLATRLALEAVLGEVTA
ncbi:hypothetical protein ACGY1D_13650 [Burkholderia pseudomallei]|uniref:hypothetical protein n=1 Tax=Burkholderia cepacia TaxID=292 RepID=UPI000758BB7C|nr:hypothetical protein [Burkholderia cepacia]KWF99102.1 hypothetical protein WL95_00360 [Burkholderia cepacia]